MASGRKGPSRRGAVVLVAMVLLASINLAIAAGMRPASDDLQGVALRVQTTRAFYAAEAGVAVLIRAVTDGEAMPASGSEMQLGLQRVVFVESLGAGEAGDAVLEGRSGEGRRRLALRIE